jgi:hypothetical protein
MPGSNSCLYQSSGFGRPLGPLFRSIMAGGTLDGAGVARGVSFPGVDVPLCVSWDFTVRELERLTKGAMLAAVVVAAFSVAAVNTAASCGTSSFCLAKTSRTTLLLMLEMRARMSNSSSSSSSS